MIKFKTHLPKATAAAEDEEHVKLPPDDKPSTVFQIKHFPQNHLTYQIHKHTAGTRPARSHNVVHASDLDPARKWCAREPALLTLHKKKRPARFVPTAQRMVWGMGYKGADLLMELIPPEKVWGNWKCRSCGHEVKYQYTPKKCAGCGGSNKAIRYVEVFLRDPETGIVGSVDLFVDMLGNGLKVPIEIKTEGNEGFKSRVKPEFDHEWRTMLYLWLTAKTPWVQDKGLSNQEGRVVYFTKEGYINQPLIKEWGLKDWGKSAIKEYWVARNDDMIQNQIDYQKTYRAWRNKYDDPIQDIGDLPLPARVSTAKSKNCTRCKDCPVQKECWG